jgi:hypothetical protein
MTHAHGWLGTYGKGATRSAQAQQSSRPRHRRSPLKLPGSLICIAQVSVTAALLASSAPCTRDTWQRQHGPGARAHSEPPRSADCKASAEQAVARAPDVLLPDHVGSNRTIVSLQGASLRAPRHPRQHRTPHLRVDDLDWVAYAQRVGANQVDAARAGCRRASGGQRDCRGRGPSRHCVEPCARAKDVWAEQLWRRHACVGRRMLTGVRNAKAAARHSDGVGLGCGDAAGHWERRDGERCGHGCREGHGLQRRVGGQGAGHLSRGTRAKEAVRAVGPPMGDAGVGSMLLCSTGRGRRGGSRRGSRAPTHHLGWRRGAHHRARRAHLLHGTGEKRR